MTDTPRHTPPHAAFATRLVRVHGRVQGVGYRHACVQQARALGVTGWVRNRTDGSVEAMLQGGSQQLARMCEWMRHEVPTARVERMDVTDLPPPFPRLERFEQHSTR
jgi:acylphosphatase